MNFKKYDNFKVFELIIWICFFVGIVAIYVTIINPELGQTTIINITEGVSQK